MSFAVNYLLLAAWLASSMDASGELAGRDISAQPSELQLVESFPVETTLDQADLPEAHDVWLEMIQQAQERLDFAQFYASNQPGSRLENIVRAIEDAARRGVEVRFLAEEKFYEIYPETLDRLNEHDNIRVRRYDMAALTGGVMHAKYFLVDSDQAYVGSQNFDWRALEHIQELGLRIRSPSLVAQLRQVFDTDWHLAAGELEDILAPGPHGSPVWLPGPTASLFVTPVFSPKGWLPDPTSWDLPHLIDAIDKAQRRVRVQLLTYRASSRDAVYFGELEGALRSAAARGVRVQLMLSHWCQAPGTIEGLKSLEILPNIEVKLVTIPEWSGGFIPYARVVHAKYMIVDEKWSWLGSSNWEKNYFYKSRNVGLIIDGQDIAQRLIAYFEHTWESEYASRVQCDVDYVAPRVAK